MSLPKLEGRSLAHSLAFFLAAASAFFPNQSSAGTIRVFEKQAIAYAECAKYAGTFHVEVSHAWVDVTATCDGPYIYDMGSGQGPGRFYRVTYRLDGQPYGLPQGNDDWFAYRQPPSADPNQGPPVCGAGNPINCATGNKYQQETDFVATDLFRFERFYNSLSKLTSSLGSYWSSTYSQRIEPLDPTHVAARRADGSGYEFTQSGTDWLPPVGVYATLTQSTDSRGITTAWTFVAEDQREIENYDGLGRLSSIVRSNGESITIVYNNGVIEEGLNDFLPTKVTDQSGRSLTLSYTNQNLTQLIDPAGSTYSYSYDASGRLSVVTYPGNVTKTYLYNEPSLTGGANLVGALTGIVDEKNQRFATFAYQADGRAVSTEHAGGVSKFALQYNDVSGTTTVSTPEGGQKLRLFNRSFPRYKLASTSETANGQTRTASHTFDASGNVDVATDAAGTATDFNFDSRGLEAQRIESANQAGTKRTTQTDWDSVFRLPTERRLLDANGALQSKLTWTYNARGQVLTATLVNLTNSALSRTTTYTYCEQAGVSAGTCPMVGLLVSIDGPRSDVVDTTTYTYRQADDASCAGSPTTCAYRKGDLWNVINAKGQVVEAIANDAVGRPRSVKDSNGVVTDLEYSTRGWLTAKKVRGADDSSEADDAITRMEYDATGAVTKVIEPDGSFVLVTYDAAHRVTDIGDASGNSVHYTLNNAGQRIQEDTKNSAGSIKRTLSRLYDTLGQLQTAADAQATPTDFFYDVNGQLDTTEDPLGRVTDNTLDALGRLVQVIANTTGGASDKATTQFQYDARDNLRTVIDPKGLSTNYTYDSLGNLTELSSPDTGSTIYSYDLAGNRTGEMKADNVSQGYVYDALGRLTAQTFAHSAQNISLTYDTTQADCATGETFSVGRLTKIANDSGSTRYCYDARGHRVRQVQTVASGTTLTTAPTYDSADRLIAMTYPSGAIVTYLRDAAGRVTRIDAVPSVGAAQVTLVSNATYLPFGPLTSLEFGSGHMLAKTYDQNYSIDGVYDSSASNPLSEDFTVDAVGNITRIDELRYNGTLTTRSYSYDGLDRLTAHQGANGGTIVESFTYDATGNRLSKNGDAYTYEATSHHLVAVAGSAGGARSYNATGETVSMASGATTKTLTYNDSHRVATVLVNGALKLTNIYNAFGQRVAKQPALASNLTQFVYDDSGHLIGEYTKIGARIKEYVWLDDTLVAVLSNHDGSTYQYIETDHLGTPRAIHPYTDATVWRWNINTSAFGEDAASDDPDANSIKYTLNVRFPGQYFDTESGLNYNYFRDYDPTTGRYVESDPVGLRGGINTYSYAGGNPVKAIDQYGLEAITISFFYGKGGTLTIGRDNGQWFLRGGAGVGFAAGISYDKNAKYPVGQKDKACPDAPNFIFGARGNIGGNFGPLGLGYEAAGGLMFNKSAVTGKPRLDYYGEGAPSWGIEGSFGLGAGLFGIIEGGVLLPKSGEQK